MSNMHETAKGPLALLDSLSSAEPNPDMLSAGGALSLAIHCLFCQSGFILVGPGKPPKASRTKASRSLGTWKPAVEWQAFPDEWNLEYILPGASAVFNLTIAYQKVTGKVLVHASEDGNLDNIRPLGLLLDKYITPTTTTPSPPGSTAAKACPSSWSQRLQNLDVLCDLVTQHVLVPLRACARPGHPPVAHTRTLALFEQQSQSLLCWLGDADWGTSGLTPSIGFTLVGGIALVAGLLLISWRSSSQRHVTA